MTTIVEIEQAIRGLERSEVESLFFWMEKRVKAPGKTSPLPTIDETTFNETSRRILREHDALLRKLSQ